MKLWIMRLLMSVLAVVVAACGGDKGGGDTGSAATSETSTTGATTTGASTTEAATTEAATTEASTSEASTTGASSATTGDGPPAACMCPVTNSCGAGLCANVSVTCEGYCGDTPPILNSEASLKCALTALRERTPGLITWSSSENGGQFGSDTTLWILADGTAMKTGSRAEDRCSYTGPDVLGPLEDPAYFDGCLADPDPLSRFDCMRGALAGQTIVCSPEQESCDF